MGFFVNNNDNNGHVVGIDISGVKDAAQNVFSRVEIERDVMALDAFILKSFKKIATEGSADSELVTRGHKDINALLFSPMRSHYSLTSRARRDFISMLVRMSEYNAKNSANNNVDNVSTKFSRAELFEIFYSFADSAFAHDKQRNFAEKLLYSGVSRDVFLSILQELNRHKKIVVGTEVEEFNVNNVSINADIINNNANKKRARKFNAKEADVLVDSILVHIKEGKSFTEAFELSNETFTTLERNFSREKLQILNERVREDL